jgi:hypothetical protein
MYRKGMLYLYNNTIISTRTGNTTLLRLSSNGESAEVRNNIIFVTASGAGLGIVDSDGAAELRNNWFKTGWRVSHSNAPANVKDMEGNRTGASPGFVEFASEDFALAEGSECINGGNLLATACQNDYRVLFEYVKHQSSRERRQDAVPDIGAYEYGGDEAVRSGQNPMSIWASQTGNRIHPAIAGLQGHVLYSWNAGFTLLGRYVSANANSKLTVNAAGIGLPVVDQRQ